MVTAPDFAGDTYPVTQSGPIPAPLTLDEVGEIGRIQASCPCAPCEECDVREECGGREELSLVATIEWLAEPLRRLFIDSNEYSLDVLAEDEAAIEAWLRSEA